MGKVVSGVLVLVYIIVGVVVAQSNDYLAGLDSLEAIVSAILAILLWPLVLLDVNLHIGSIDNPSDDKPSGGDGSGDKPSGTKKN